MDAVRARVGTLTTLALAGLVVAVALFTTGSPTSKPIDFVGVLERAEFARRLGEAEVNARLAEREVVWVDLHGCSYWRKEAKKVRAKLEEFERAKRQLEEKIRLENMRPQLRPRRFPPLTKREIEACRTNALCMEVRR